MLIRAAPRHPQALTTDSHRNAYRHWKECGKVAQGGIRQARHG